MNSPKIVPFWNRLPAFASYPINGDAKISLIGFSIGLALLGWVPFVRPLLWAGVLKYAFEILLATANGKMKSPEISINVSNGVIWRYLLLQTLTVALPMLAMAMIGPGVGIALLVLMVLVQPAAILGLALTESLRRALNPGLWFAVMGRMGWPYLALFGLLMVIQLSAVNAGELLASVMPGFLANGVVAVLTIWSLFATFHLMGYMVFQYHEEFGFEPTTLTQQAAMPFSRDRELMEAAGARIEAGEAAQARELLRAELRTRAVALEVHELYRRLLQQAGDRTALLDHGRSFLHQLMIEKQERRAMALLRECLELDAGFVPLDPEHTSVLVERAAFGGQSKLAVDLLLAQWQHQPEHPQAADWVLRAAEMMMRHSGREAEARQLLSKARARCDCPVTRSLIDTQLAAIPA